MSGPRSISKQSTIDQIGNFIEGLTEMNKIKLVFSADITAQRGIEYRALP